MGNSVNTLCTCVISDDNLDASMFEEYDIGPPPRLSITPYYPEEVPYLFSNDSELGTPLSLEDESTTISSVVMSTKLQIDVDKSVAEKENELLDSFESDFTIESITQSEYKDKSQVRSRSSTIILMEVGTESKEEAKEETGKKEFCSSYNLERSEEKVFDENHLITDYTEIENHINTLDHHSYQKCIRIERSNSLSVLSSSLQNTSNMAPTTDYFDRTTEETTFETCVSKLSYSQQTQDDNDNDHYKESLKKDYMETKAKKSEDNPCFDTSSLNSFETNEDSISLCSYGSNGSLISRAYSEIIIGQSCDKYVPSKQMKEILESSLRNPQILVGYEVYVEKYGIGIIKDCLRMKFFATKFDVHFNNGRRKSIKLKRSELKSGSNFTLLRKLT